MNYKKDCLVITSPFLESFRPPISGATICAVLEKENCNVFAWDANIELYKLSGYKYFNELQNKFIGLDEITLQDKKFINDFIQTYDFSRFEFICISLFSSYSHLFTIYLLEHLKKIKNKSKIIIGGSGVSEFFNNEKFGDYVIKQNLCKYYIEGEGEIALSELIRGNDQYFGINGKLPKQIDDINILPIPNYDYYNLDDYDYLLPNNKDLFIYGSRGCVRNCTFCNVPSLWPKFRWRSGENIAYELIGNYEKYGVKNFFFTDSLINGNLKEYKKLHETLAKSNLPKFHIAGYAIIRPKNQHPAEMFDMLANNGTHFWSIGIEHGSDEVRKHMQKKFTNADIDWHLEQSYRVGLQNNFLMIPTYITETEKNHKEYMEVFPRWQKYVATNTITSMVFSPTLTIMRDTPLYQPHYNLEFMQSENETLNENFWINRDNTDLTFKERIIRTLSIFEQANRYKYPLLQIESRLLRIKSLIEKYKSL